MKKKFLFVALSLLVFASLVFAFLPLNSNFLMVHSTQSFYTFVLDKNNYNFLTTSASSGVTNDSNSPRTNGGSPITFSYGYARRSGSRILLTQNSGYLANQTPFTGLRSITVNMPSGKANLSYGSSTSNYCDPIQITNNVRYEIDSLPYFKITAGSSTPYINSITVEYLCNNSGELDPVKQHTHNGYHYQATEPTVSDPGNKEFYACSDCAYVSLVKEDDGNYVDTILTYKLPSNHIAYIAPSMLKQPTQFGHPIAVSLEVPSANYQVDQTGATDASATIQAALNYVMTQGGGTVYIPAGRYLLNNQITIPYRVTLVGDFKGPDSDDDYGTVFLCNKSPDPNGTLGDNSQIIVSSNAGINGITFYYPNQDINQVVEYGHTIYAHNNATATLSNLYFINSYNGIAVNDVEDSSTGGELVNIENVYGTFLHSGISGYYQSDAGSWNNINISPSFYANALSGYRCNDSTALYKYTRENLVAMTLGDLDDFSFDKVYIDNAKIGIYFPDQVIRPAQAFWGILNDINLTDCLTGIYATGLFSGGGAVFTHSVLGKVINVSNKGILKLSKCQYSELLGSGNTAIEYGSESYEASPSHDDSYSYNIPANLYYVENLDNTGATDVSADLQTEINKCQDGGVIVMKNGTYRLNNPITLPSNTMITSFSNSFTRTSGSEYGVELVKFISYSSDACVKLGSSSGINGIRIYNVYKDPDMAYSTLSAGQSDSFVSVKALGNNCFAINTEATYTFTGFDFSSSSNHYLKYCYGCAYETFIKVGGSGKVISSLSNLNFLARNCLYTFAQENASTLEKYYNFEDSSKDEPHEKVLDITRTYATMVKINGGSEQVLSTFSYGVKTLIDSVSATLLAVNTSQDNLKDANYVYIINGGDAKIVNSFRVFGNSFNLISGHLEIYGRLDFVNKREAYYNSSSSSSDDPEPVEHNMTESVLTYCEYSLSGVSGASRNSSYKKQGSYSWRSSSTTNPAISYSFTSRDISSYTKQGYLRFYLYVTNINNKGYEYVVELTSSGTCDSDEITCKIDNQVRKTGWNEIIVRLSDLSTSAGTFNPKAANYFRFYTNGSSCYHYIDYISFFYKPATNNPLVINECEDAAHTGVVELSDFRMDGEYSFKSINANNLEFVYYQFSSMNISSYMTNGYLSFYLYVPHLDLLGSYVIVELSSSGIWDNQEIYCNARSYFTEEGWNHIEIPLSSFIKGSESEFDPTNLNFFRLYTLTANGDFYLDDISLVKYSN